MQAIERRAAMRRLRQDFSFIVTALLVLTVIVSALTALVGDEAEFIGMDDDLHALAGWVMVILAGLHTLLHVGQMVSYAKRRLRRLFGVGGVIDTGVDCKEGVASSRAFEARRRADVEGVE
jgi:predicted ThiF/HesA family dinucleotide-utilizing enzyme